MRFFRLSSAAMALCCVLALFVLASLPVCYGQTAAGMTGTVTDPSGAVVPGAVVTLTNPSRGLKYTQTTNGIGMYRFTALPTGAGYEVTFSAKGFATLTVKDIFLAVATTRTQDATLVVGARAEAVQVSAANALITLDTTDATVGNDIPVQSLNDLPIQQRADPTALFTLQAGVTVDGSVSGARVDQNYVTLDGLDVNDFATGNASQSNAYGVSSGFEGGIVGHAPVDSVEQFHAGVAGNTADTGAASGGQFALVTKSGTNHFHGNLNEYHRDPSFVANSWFSNNATPIVPRQKLVQNQFGGAIGGPITIPHLFSGKDRAFFFFDYNDSRTAQSALVIRTVPTADLRNGIIHYPKADGTMGTATPADVKALDPAGIGESSTWLAFVDNRIPATGNGAGQCSLTTSVGDGINNTGCIFNSPQDDFLQTLVGRVDYNLNDNMKMFARFSVTREDVPWQPNAWPGDPLTNPEQDRSYAWVIGHNWVIGANKTNRVWLGETVQKLAFANDYNPQGSSAMTFSDGITASMTSNLYNWPASSGRRVPLPVLGDDFSLIKGTHTYQLGGTFKDILANTANITDFNMGMIGLGGQVEHLTPDLRPADISASGANTWDVPFTWSLARIASLQSTFNYDKSGNALQQMTGDQRFYRYYQMQLYVQDTWKVLPSLTLNYGLNYQWFSVPYETRGLEAVEPYTMNQYLAARAIQSQLGQSGPDAVPIIPYLLGGKGNGSGAPGLYKPEYRNFAPHVGFAWNVGPDKKTVINGSAAVVYDRTVIMAVQSLQDAYSYLFQQTKTLANGIPGDAYDSLATDPRLDSNSGFSAMTIAAPPTPKAPYQPFADPSYCTSLNPTFRAPCGLQDGQEWNSATIDPGLKNPYNFVFNFGVQRNLPWDMLLKAQYVGRLGRRLLGQADMEQLIDFPDNTGRSNQTLGQAVTAVEGYLRQGIAPSSIPAQPWFEDMMTNTPAISACPSGGNTCFVTGSGTGGNLYLGDFADFVQLISAYLPLNVGMAAQFSENSFFTNDAFSDYNGLLFTLSKNLSHGLQFDFNYTWSHSIDNISFFANSEGDTGIGSGLGLICDVMRPRECRARSDFDMRHLISTDATYQLPFGKGRMFFATVPHWTDEIIGNWDLSGIASFHTGEPWTTSSLAFVPSYSNDAPAVFIGSDPSVIKNHVKKLLGGGVADFNDPTAASGSFEGPTGFNIGPRNQMTGPNFFNTDLGLAKEFPVYREALNLKFRADAFNALNHPNFSNPVENIYNGLDQTDYTGFLGNTFGAISTTVEPPGNLNRGARVLQLSLRLEF